MFLSYGTTDPQVIGAYIRDVLHALRIAWEHGEYYETFDQEIGMIIEFDWQLEQHLYEAMRFSKAIK